MNRKNKALQLLKFVYNATQKLEHLIKLNQGNDLENKTIEDFGNYYNYILNLPVLTKLLYNEFE